MRRIGDQEQRIEAVGAVDLCHAELGVEIRGIAQTTQQHATTLRLGKGHRRTLVGDGADIAELTTERGQQCDALVGAQQRLFVRIERDTNHQVINLGGGAADEIEMAQVRWIE